MRKKIDFRGLKLNVRMFPNKFFVCRIDSKFYIDIEAFDLCTLLALKLLFKPILHKYIQI